MSEDPKNIVERIKKKYKNESPENRISRWVLGTIKFQHDAAYILGSGAHHEDKSSKESFEKLSKEEQEYLLNICLNSYKRFKKYLLVYVCYLFGGYYENCKRRKMKFSFTGPFLIKQLENFFGMVNQFYKKPDKESNLWSPFMDTLFGRDDLDINKKFFLAHLPPLEKKHYESIVNWFLDNRKTNDSIKKIFDTARNYFHLEDDDKSPFKKITSENDYAGSAVFATDADTNKYENSVINKDYPLRFTYYKLAVDNIASLNECYLYSKPKARVWIVDDLISKIIKNGPDLKLMEQKFDEI